MIGQGRLLAFIFVFFGCFYPFALSAFELSIANGQLVNDEIAVFHDASNKLSINQLIQPHEDLPFESIVSIAQVNASESLWLKLTLTNRDIQQRDFVVHLDNPSLELIDFYLVKDKQLIDSATLGRHKHIAPISSKAFPHLLSNLPANSRATLFIRVKSNGLPHVPVYLHSIASFDQTVNVEFALWGVYIGIVLLMLFYNGALFIYSRSYMYLYHSSFLISALLVTGLSHGYIYFILPDDLVFKLVGQDVSFKFLMAGFAILFAVEFLKSHSQQPMRSVLVGQYFSFLCFILALICIFLPEQFNNQLITVSQVAFYGLMTWILSNSYSNKERWSKTFIISWLPIYYASLIVPLNYYGVVPYDHLTTNSFMLAIVLQVALITLAHAERYRVKEQKHQYLSTHDPVCGLPNHIVLNKALAQLHLAGRAHTLLFFKPYTYTTTRANFGIVHANEYLIELCFQLNDKLDGLNMFIFEERNQGSSVFICRFNDETFALLIDTKIEELLIEQYVSNIKEALEQGIYLDGTYLVGQVDIGIASYPVHALSADLLIQRALQSLQFAAGEVDHWCLYQQDTDALMRNRLKLAADLHQAIANNEFSLYHQPQIDLRNNSIYGSEALLRWKHPELGFIPPDEFIPVAESAGLINEITEWVVEQALLHHKHILSSLPSHKISINISARDLNKRELPVQLLTLLTELNIKPSSIVIELTESATVKDKTEAKNVLDDFKEMGIKVAIDDYGTGYSSLAYLSQLGFHEIKIDKQFVFNLESNRRHQTICKTTIEMAKNLDAYVVAEGVESELVAKMLRQYGCEIAQGYYFSKPMPFSEYCQWLERYAQSA